MTTVLDMEACLSPLFNMYRKCENFLSHINTHKSSPTVEEPLNSHMGKMACLVGIHGIDTFL